MAGADGSIPPPPKGAPSDSLAAEVGPLRRAPRAARAVFRGADEAWMLARGQVTATEVILTTGASFVRSTRAIYASLSAAQRASLLGYDPSFDAVVAHELGALRELNARYDRVALSAGLSVGERKQRAREAHSAAVAARLAAWQTLRDLLGASHPVMAGLTAAMKAAETTDIAADGLDSVADAIDRLRAEDPELRDDLDLVKLDDAYVASLRGAAAKARAAARVVEAKPQELAAAQRALDLLDGRVLHAIGVVSRAFRRARRVDAPTPAPNGGVTPAAPAARRGGAASPSGRPPPRSARRASGATPAAS